MLEMATLFHGTRKICKSALSYNPAVITRGIKELWSRGSAPLEAGVSKRTFQIIPVSQNNAVTQKYHLTSVNQSEYQIQSTEHSFTHSTCIYIAHLGKTSAIFAQSNNVKKYKDIYIVNIKESPYPPPFVCCTSTVRALTLK